MKIFGPINLGDSLFCRQKSRVTALAQVKPGKHRQSLGVDAKNRGGRDFITKRWGCRDSQSLQIVGVTDFCQLRKVGVAGKLQKIGVAEFEITKR